MPTVLARPAAPMVTRASPRWGDAWDDPTLASAWRAVAGTTIGDELLEWPPDVFALSEVLLQRSEAYRFALSPPAGFFDVAARQLSGLARRGRRCGPAVELLGRGPEPTDPGPAGPGVGGPARTGREPAERSHRGSRLAAV